MKNVEFGKLWRKVGIKLFFTKNKRKCFRSTRFLLLLLLLLLFLLLHMLQKARKICRKTLFAVWVLLKSKYVEKLPKGINKTFAKQKDITQEDTNTLHSFQTFYTCFIAYSQIICHFTKRFKIFIKRHERFMIK